LSHFIDIFLSSKVLQLLATERKEHGKEKQKRAAETAQLLELALQEGVQEGVQKRVLVEVAIVDCHSHE
jgi:hypothetical protein